jgi:hypothetical protein
MSSLQGYITIPKSILVELFGDPLPCDEEPQYAKVRNEWILEITDPNGDTGVVTIYDWKNYHMPGDDLPGDFDEWHVGGHSPQAPNELRELLIELSSRLKNPDLLRLT